MEKENIYDKNYRLDLIEGIKNPRLKKLYGVTFIKYEKRGNQLKAIEHLMLHPTTLYLE